VDPITLIGITLGLLAVLTGALWEGTHISALWTPTAALIILGGTTGATLACYSLREVKELVSSTRNAFRKPAVDVVQVIDVFVELATLVRREGLLMLENHPVKIDHPLLKRGLQLMVDGTDPNMLKDMLATQIAVAEHEAKMQAGIWQTAGGFAPTMGIIGTVMGLIHVLGNLSDPSSLGPAISVAFLATLYGIATANLVFLPLAKKLMLVAKNNTQVSELVVEGITSIQMGENPRVIEEKLLSYVDEHNSKLIRAKRQSAKEKK
jgi:chemotaxis protein MotA